MELMPLKVKLARPRGSATRGKEKLISSIDFSGRYLTPKTARGFSLWANAQNGDACGSRPAALAGNPPF